VPVGSRKTPALAAAAVLALFCALSATAHAARHAQADTRPNIVVLETDDQTAESLRVMQQTRALLGSAGTTFARSFVSFPLCCPSRATFLTGQYSHNNGVLHNAGAHGGYPALDHTNALPVWLQEAGYRTILLGRYLNGYGTLVDRSTIPPGWTDWHSTIDPSTFDYRSWDMNDNGQITSYPTPDHPGEYQTDFYTRRAAELIGQAAPSPQPFFMWLTFSAPHSGQPRDPDDPPGFPTPSPSPLHRDQFAGTPLPRDPSFDEADVSDKPDATLDLPRLSPESIAAIRENYSQELESLQSVDETVASVVAALGRSGELDNTLLVFTSDNGYMHGEHRHVNNKVIPYEPALRVPLIMRGPGVPAGRVDKRLVANIDLAPTILDAANASPHRVEDGRSLLQLLADPGKEWGRELLLENGQGANGVAAYRGVRNYRYAYAYYYNTGDEELYDLRRDPFELVNRAQDQRFESLRARLARRAFLLRRCRGARCRARPRLRAARRCVSRGLAVGLGGADARLVSGMEVRLGSSRVARDRRAPFLRVVPRRRLRSRGTRLLRVRVTTRDGRIVTLDRRLPACR
jgi:N-acetylglucosamine-6-sulfatase